MRHVSIYALAFIALLATSAVYAADGDAPSPKSATAKDRKPESVENVDESADLATTLGVGNDVHFARPRTFRAESFNSEHLDVEPLAADPPEHNTPEP